MASEPGPCGHVHTSQTAVAVGRFLPGGPTGYRAASGGPLRSTRARAERDECESRHTPTPTNGVTP